MHKSIEYVFFTTCELLFVQYYIINNKITYFYSSRKYKNMAFGFNWNMNTIICYTSETGWSHSNTLI